VRWLILVALFACHPGGEYAPTDRESSGVDRGDTNGRTFDFVSNKPDGDDWQIRVRGTALWVSYAREDSTDKLGSRNLTDKESRKIWRLVDAIDIPSRKKGQKDDDSGYLTLVLREPGAEQHDITTIYVSRDKAEKDDDVVALASYFQELIAKYYKETPNF
jgi:hypothetical protein